MLRWGEDMEIVTLGFKKFPVINHTPPDTRRLTNEELVTLLSGASPDFADWIHFAVLTGLRPKEQRELQKLAIKRTSCGSYAEILNHKTRRTARSARPRTVPLCQSALDIIERQTAQHPTSPYIFLNADGNPYTKFALRNRLRRLCKRLEVQEIQPYALRHTFASLHSDAGIESTSLARLMGHTTTRTLERYVHNSQESHQRAVDGVEDQIRETLQKADPKVAGGGKTYRQTYRRAKTALKTESENTVQNLQFAQ